MKKQEFVRKVADEAGLPLATTKVFMSAFEDVFKKAVEDQERICFPSMFLLDFKKINPRKRFNPFKNEFFESNGGIKAVLKIATNLKKTK